MDGEIEVELPSARQITREAFAGDEFKVDEFLYQYHRFQTLEDMQKQLRHWKKELEQELIEVINRDYEEFVGLGRALSGGESKVQDVKVEVLSFERQVTSVQSTLDRNCHDIGQLLNEKRRILADKNRVKRLILFTKRLSTLESDLGCEDYEDVRDCAKAYLALRRVADKLAERDETFIRNQKDRLVAIRSVLVERMRAQLRHAKTAGDNDQVLEMVLLTQEVDRVA